MNKSFLEFGYGNEVTITVKLLYGATTMNNNGTSVL